MPRTPISLAGFIPIVLILTGFFLEAECVSNDDASRNAVEAHLEANKLSISSNLLVSQGSDDGSAVPSLLYKYEHFIDSLRKMSQDGVADKFFYTGDGSSNGPVYGLVNVAAFLAQGMEESIKNDACDEYNWDIIAGRYPFSNACGQGGRSYQDMRCSIDESHMECAVDPDMTATAVSSASWDGAPPPLFCGPKSAVQFTGFYDPNTGEINMEVPYANRRGRVDVEGCCWWGRGIIHTNGVCNLGKLNYYIGKKAADDGRNSLYPDIDFCANPNAICEDGEREELKWITGMFQWMENVQTYDRGGWNYMAELHRFVDNGMEDVSFIYAVSGIVDKGCHSPPCLTGQFNTPETGELESGPERKTNFDKVLSEIGLPTSASVASFTHTTISMATVGMAVMCLLLCHESW